MLHPFYKTRLVYQLLTYINLRREELVGELVAYTKDPVRNLRRMRMLTQLAQYEYQTLIKIKNFETNSESDIDDELLAELKLEVDALINRDA